MAGGFAEVQAGYVVALGGLALYGSTLLLRERSARRRLAGSAPPAPRPAGRSGAAAGEAGGDEEPSTAKVPG